MSEENDPSSSNPDASPPPAAPGESNPPPQVSPPTGKLPEKEAGKKAPNAKTPGRWRRRFARTFIVLIVCGIAIQILLWALLPWMLHRAARYYGIDLTCDRPDLSLFNSDAGLWHVKLSQNGKEFARADYCRADISLLSLLRGRLVIQRLEANGVDLSVERSEDGSIPLIKGLLFSGSHPAATKPKSAAANPTGIDLRAPVAIDALVLTRVRTHLIDRAVKPGFDTEVQMNLYLTDVASMVRPPKLTIQLTPAPLSAALLDSIDIEAGCKRIGDRQSLDAYFSANARGLHPRLLEGYLAPWGVRVTAEGVTMSARGNVAINVIPANPNAISGLINLKEMAISADGQKAAAMNLMSIKIDSFGAGTASVAQIAMSDGMFLAERTASGSLRMAGFEFTPGAYAAAPSPAPLVPASEGARPAAAVAGNPSADPTPWSVGEVSLNNFRAAFKDAAVTPAVAAEFRINSLTVKNIQSDPAHPDSAAAVAGEFTAPGILHDLKIDGSCRGFGAKKTFDLGVVASGIHPLTLAPYLALLGVTSDLNSGTFSCKLSADLSVPADNRIAANARLSDVRLDDGQELLALNEVKLTGIGLAPGSVQIDSIDVSGPHAAARREKSGALWAAGFRYAPGARLVAPSPQRAKSPATQPVASAVPPATLPKIDIGRFRWSGVQLHLDDQAAPQGESTSVSIEDAGVELSGLHLDFDPRATTAPAPARLHAFLKAPGLAGEMDLNGTIAQQPGGLAANLQLRGDNLTATLVAPYLKALNVEPTLRDATVHAAAHIDIAQVNDGISASVRAQDFGLNDPTGELLGADEAAIDGIRLTATRLDIGQIAIKKPRGQFSRDENGAINAIGFRLLPAAPAPQKSAFAAGTMLTPAGIAPPPGKPSLPSATQPAPARQVLTLGKFLIRDGAFAWTDRAVKPAAQVMARVNGDIDGVTWGEPANPAKLAFTLKVDGTLDEGKIQGTFQGSPQGAEAKLDLSAIGLKQGILPPYLPPGMSIEVKDGRFKTHLDAHVAVNPAGGAGGELLVSALDFRDADDKSPLFSLDSLKVSAPRLDAPGGILDIDEISLVGAQTTARLDSGGTLHAMGIALSPSTQAAPSTQPAARATAAAQPPAASATADALAEVTPTTSSIGKLEVVRPKYPLVTVKKLDLNVRQLTLIDQSRENVAPLTVSDLHFIADKPIEALGKDAAIAPPTELGLTLKLDDVIDSLNVHFKLWPFAREPGAVVDITANGIHGDGLLAQAPQLKSQIDASKLTDGRLHAHFYTKIKLDRFDPLSFPLDRAFNIDASVREVEFRERENGPVLIGVEEIRSEGVHVQPADRRVVVKTLEVENIVGRATREKDGIHAMGVVLKTEQPAATQPASVNLSREKPGAAAASAAAAPALPTSGSGASEAGEIQINRFFVSGMDFRFEDNTVSPPLTVPLNQLDVEVRNLSSRETTAMRPPTRFSVLVGSGKVKLPRKSTRSAVASGIIGVGKFLEGKTETAVIMEDRDLFSQIQVDGELSFFPKPRGWAKASVSAFDLASLGSSVKTFNVDLTNGVFDTAVDARLPGDGSLQTESHFIFTDLDMSEPPDGPMRRFLQAPAPMNMVLGALTRADGSIDVPISMTVRDKTLDAGEISAAAVRAIGPIMVNAIAAAPVKGVSAVGDVFGAVTGLGGEKQPTREEPIRVAFAAGDDGLSSTCQSQLAALARRMRETPDLEITLWSALSGGLRAGTGMMQVMGGDVGRARLRANPSQEECRELIKRLSRRKDDLLRLRVDLLGQARSAVAARAASETTSLARLHGVERELAATEEALDRLYELERPGANRQADRRTKKAALDVADSREKEIAARLAALGVAPARVKTTRPQFNPAQSQEIAGGSVVIELKMKKKN